MSLGKLLTAGKSLMGGHDASRYQLHKHNRLPTFGAARNPFAAAARTEILPAPPSPALPEFSAPAANPSPVAIPIPAKHAAHLAVVGQVVRDLGAQWGKVNPFGRLARRPGPVRSAISPFGDPLPVQAELSLEKVRVVRNDLSDADLEIVPAAVPVAAAESLPLLAAIGKNEPSGNAWTRLTTRFFGAGTTT